MFGTGIIDHFNRQLVSPEKIQQILPTNAKHADAIKISPIRNWGHYRKMIVDDGETRYLVYASLNAKYIRKTASLVSKLSENRINVPSIISLHAGQGRLATKRYYLVLEYINGEKAGKDDCDETTKSIAENIGKMHAISATKPGFLLKTHQDKKKMIRRHKHIWPNTLKLLGKFPEFTSKLPAKQYDRWLGEKAALFNPNGPFYLLHGDLNPGNIIIRKDGQAVLIDYDDCHYEYPGPELFRCLITNYCKSSLEKQLIFLDTYRRHIAKENWLLWEDNTAAMTGFGILKLMGNRLRRSQLLKKMGETRRSRVRFAQCLDLWDWLQDIIVAFPDGRGDWPSIMAFYTQEHTKRMRKTSP